MNCPDRESRLSRDAARQHESLRPALLSCSPKPDPDAITAGPGTPPASSRDDTVPGETGVPSVPARLLSPSPEPDLAAHPTGSIPPAASSSRSGSVDRPNPDSPRSLLHPQSLEPELHLPSARPTLPPPSASAAEAPQPNGSVAGSARQTGSSSRRRRHLSPRPSLRLPSGHEATVKTTSSAPASPSRHRSAFSPPASPSPVPNSLAAPACLSGPKLHSSLATAAPRSTDAVDVTQSGDSPSAPDSGRDTGSWFSLPTLPVPEAGVMRGRSPSVDLEPEDDLLTPRLSVATPPGLGPIVIHQDGGNVTWKSSWCGEG